MRPQIEVNSDLCLQVYLLLVRITTRGMLYYQYIQEGQSLDFVRCVINQISYIFMGPQFLTLFCTSSLS